MLAWHVTKRPMGGVFERIVPVPGDFSGAPNEKEITRVLDSREMPDLEPGEKAFQKAHELIAMGDIAGAREKLNTIVTIYPGSSSASNARRILGEMNFDDLLSADHKEGKKSYIVQKGDSFMGIALKQQTTLDCLMHLNGLMDLGGLQPHEELWVLPLNFRLLVEPKSNSISLWDGGNFLKEFPVVRVEHAGPVAPVHTTVDSKIASFESKRLQPGMKGFRESDKSISLAKTGLQIRAMPSEAGGGAMQKGFYIAPEDMEELWLVTRPGNEVEIRLPAH
jgi:hypothetical protein